MARELRYAALTAYLRECNSEKVRLTFDELNAIITIPDYAYRHRPAWGNNTSGTASPFQRGWLDAGYAVFEINFAAEYVVFAKSTMQVSQTGTHSAVVTVQRKPEPQSAEEELQLTIPDNLTGLTADKYLMVALTKENSVIVEDCIAHDPAYQSKGESIMHSFFDHGDFSAEAYYAIINRIAAENSTRTPETSMRQLAAYCAEPGNHFLEKLEAGTPELVDVLTNYLTANGSRKDKSLCSKLCRYINEWHFGGCAYTINDSVVRAIMPYYLAYYKVDRALWQGKNFEELSYVEFYTIFTALRNCVPELNNHELDHLIWYAYKNDSIRSEVAKALAKALV